MLMLRAILLVMILLSSNACRTGGADAESNTAEAVSGESVFEIACTSRDSNKSFKISGIGSNQDRGGNMTSLVKISGYGPEPVTYTAQTTLKEVETRPVTYSWDFVQGEVQIEVNSFDKKTGKAVLVRGTGKSTERIDFSCKLYQSQVANADKKDDEPSVGIEDVNRIECKSSGSEKIVMVSVGSDIHGEGDALTEVRNTGMSYLPDQFIAETTFSEIETNPVTFSWTFRYRDSYIEINSMDNVKGKGVVFVEIPGDSRQYQITCDLMSLIGDAVTQ